MHFAKLLSPYKYNCAIKTPKCAVKWSDKNKVLEHIDEYSSTTALSYHLQHQEPATWLTDGFRERVFAYMAGTAKELNGFALKVGGFYDHSLLLIRVTV
jgi:hypothetical protein